MKPKYRSILWDYFDKLNNSKALCRFCNEEYSFQTTTGNLKGHLKKKHHQAYLQVVEAQEQLKAQASKGTANDKEEVIYLVAENPTSPANSERTDKSTPDMLQTRNSRHSFLKRNRLKTISEVAAELKQKRLITHLTKEKIAVTSMQKELMEKELEEKTAKVLLLQEEIEHKRHIYQLEKQEMEHRKELQMLAQEEMQLKIELLRSNLAKKSTTSETITLSTTDE